MVGMYIYMCCDWLIRCKDSNNADLEQGGILCSVFPPCSLPAPCLPEPACTPIQHAPELIYQLESSAFSLLFPLCSL